MELRISAGEFKNRKLVSLPGKELRPLSGRIKESFFSIIAGRIPGSLFLDLFAGTGNVSLEALSRGAAKAVLVEKEPSSLKLIRENIERLRVSDRAQLYASDVFSFHREMSPDIIFAGPPYKADLSSRILAHCRENRLAVSGTLVVVQHHKNEVVDHSGYDKTDARLYGITALDFFSLKDRGSGSSKDIVSMI